MGVFASQPLDEQVAYSLLTEPPPRPKEGNAPGKTAERRRSFRRPLGIVATMSRLINGEAVHPLLVLVINCSEHGFGMRSPATFTKHDVYELKIGTGDAARLQSVRIVGCRSRGDGSFDVGAETL